MLRRADSPLDAETGRSKRRKLLSLGGKRSNNSPATVTPPLETNEDDNSCSATVLTRRTNPKGNVETAVDQLLSQSSSKALAFDSSKSKRLNSTTFQTVNERNVDHPPPKSTSSVRLTPDVSSFSALKKNDPFSLFDDDIRDTFGCSKSQPKSQQNRANTNGICILQVSSSDIYVYIVPKVLS